MIATASYDGTAILWDANSGQMIGSPLKAGPGSLTDVDWSPDGRLVAAAAMDNSVYVWEVKSQNLVRKLDLFTDNVNSVSFNPNGQLLAAGSSDAQVRVWDFPLLLLHRHSKNDLTLKEKQVPVNVGATLCISQPFRVRCLGIRQRIVSKED